MARWLACFFVLFVPALGVFAAPGFASLSALEGDVTVVRAGTLIPSEKIAEGFALEDFDTVITGRTGRADVRFLPQTGLSAAVRLDSETALYIDVVAKKEQTVGIELLTGGVTVQVTSAFGRSQLEVRTDAGSFAQAGPGFRAVMAASGETLVLTRTGKVTCRVGNRVVSAEPGTVVEAATAVKTVPVNVSTLDAYEAGWLADKKQALRDTAAPLLRSLGTRYQLELGRFQRAWDRSQREAGGPSRSVQAATADLRRSAAPLERSMPRVQVLRRLFDEGLIGPSFELTRGYAAKDFFKAWDRESTEWMSRLAQARGRYKDVVNADGQFPRTSDLPEITYSSDYFH